VHHTGCKWEKSIPIRIEPNTINELDRVAKLKIDPEKVKFIPVLEKDDPELVRTIPKI
jgi:hypothetical protein